MKKSYALLLTALSAGGFFAFLLWKAHYRALPQTRLGGERDQHDALLSCAKLRTIHVDNSLGFIQINAAQAFILKDHTIITTTVKILLKQKTGRYFATSADNAIFSTTSGAITFNGNVASTFNAMPARTPQQ